MGAFQMSNIVSQQEFSDVEQISPFTIWNDTGYPLHIEPYLAGTNAKGISFSKKMALEPGSKQDMIVGWSVDRIFESSTKEVI